MRQMDLPSTIFFYHRGPVPYFYCSKKIHQSYAAEGIGNPKMPFEEFVQSEFFQREPDATSADSATGTK